MVLSLGLSELGRTYGVPEQGGPCLFQEKDTGNLGKTPLATKRWSLENDGDGYHPCSLSVCLLAGAGATDGRRILTEAPHTPYINRILMSPN